MTRSAIASVPGHGTTFRFSFDEGRAGAAAPGVRRAARSSLLPFQV